MTIDTLNRANVIKKTIDKLNCEKSRISKLYSKKDNLTTEEIKEIIQMAMVNTDYTLKCFNKELEEL
jgi:hypothetical protein